MRVYDGRLEIVLQFIMHRGDHDHAPDLPNVEVAAVVGATTFTQRLTETRDETTAKNGMIQSTPSLNQTERHTVF